ncbi:MAG: GAF domain-containing sensor histidine kinase [Chthonomonas sp.]|nr:GAF domain-containing sensor histidine kinase [Chthonomonas sp.]
MADLSPLLNSVHKAARKLASSANFDTVLRDVLRICVDAAGASGGTIYLYDPSRSVLQFRHVLPEEVAEVLQLKDIPSDFGIAGQVFQTRKTVISHFNEDDSTQSAKSKQLGVATQVTSMITVPLMMETEEPIGVVQLVNKQSGQFDANDAMVLDTVSAICTMAYVNSKLLDETTRASQLLGMGKIGHDIKNLAFALEANVSFSDETLKMLRDEVEGAGVQEKVGWAVDEVEMMIKDLSLSIDRIKRYSILMSDLSAGKALQPTMHSAPLAETIRLSAAYLESEARNKCVKLVYDIQDDAPPVMHDEMYIFRIVQNLVSNAIKAVGETTEGADEEDPSTWKTVTLRYFYRDGNHVLEVIDTGPGMSQEVAESILSGNARSVWGRSSGSGWGTKIVLELAHTHHGVVSIDSKLGEGSTFRVTLPASTQ